jgi:hypothetical protein
MSDLTITYKKTDVWGSIIYEGDDIILSDGREKIVLYNRNIGATTSGTTVNAATIGTMFQWGNTWWRAYNSSVTASTQQIDGRWYDATVNPVKFPQWYYDSNSTSTNVYMYAFQYWLYGGNDGRLQIQDRGLNIPTPPQELVRNVKGFCPTGYHIPTDWERNQLFRLYFKIKWWTPLLNSAGGGHMWYADTVAHQNQFIADMKIPLSWLYNENNALQGNGTYAYLRTCEYLMEYGYPWDEITASDIQNAICLAMGGSSVNSSWSAARSCRVGVPIRTFKNWNIIYPQ